MLAGLGLATAWHRPRQTPTKVVAQTNSPYIFSFPKNQSSFPQHADIYIYRCVCSPHTSTSLSSVQIILFPTSSILVSLLQPCERLSIPGCRCPHLFLVPAPYRCLSVHRCPLWPATAVPPCAATKC